MAKNIVTCFDSARNQLVGANTNIVKLFSVLDLDKGSPGRLLQILCLS